MSTLMDITSKQNLDQYDPTVGNQESIDPVNSSSSEINEVLLKNLEDDMFHLQNELRQKDIEIQSLLEIVALERLRCDESASLKKVIQEYKEQMQGSSGEIIQLKIAFESEKQQKDNYFRLWTQEDIEKLKVENQQLQSEINKLVVLDQKVSRKRTISTNRGELSECLNLSSSNIKETRVERMRDMLAVDLSGENLSTQKSYHSNHNDWIIKVDSLKEKVMSEERRNRELQYVIIIQQNMIDSTKENMMKLESDNSILNHNLEKLKSEFESLRETEMKERVKLENISCFYEIMQKTKSPRNKKYNIPDDSSKNLLRSSSDQETYEAFSDEKNQRFDCLKPNKLLPPIASLHDAENIRENHSNSFNEEIHRIKNEINELTQYVQRSINPETIFFKDSSLETNSIPLEHARSSSVFNSEGIDFNRERIGKDPCWMSSQLTGRERPILAKAVLNSNSLWHQLRSKIKDLNQDGK